MRTVGRHAAALVLLIGLTTGAEGRPLPAAQQEPEQTRIRVAVDVVAVDVQVIDRTGRPVPDLGPEHFTVTGASQRCTRRT